MMRPVMPPAETTCGAVSLTKPGEFPMLSNLSPYSAPGLATSFPGLTAGFSPVSPSPIGLSGAYGGNAFGQDASMLSPYGQSPFSQNGLGQNPFVPGQMGQAGFVQNGLGQGAFGQAPFAPNPMAAGVYGQTPFGQGFFGQSPLTGPYPATTQQTQQIIATLAQLAQHISTHSVAAQQIGLILNQVAQQLALQKLYGPGSGVGFGLQPAGYAALNPQLYAGFNPQAQVWGAGRPYTIQPYTIQ
jgi:hypothetical protein